MYIIMHVHAQTTDQVRRFFPHDLLQQSCNVRCRSRVSCHSNTEENVATPEKREIRVIKHGFVNLEEQVHAFDTALLGDTG